MELVQLDDLVPARRQRRQQLQAVRRDYVVFHFGSASWVSSGENQDDLHGYASRLCLPVLLPQGGLCQIPLTMVSHMPSRV